MIENRITRKINLIMAEQNGLIGIGNYLPWDHHSGDMKFFKEKTENNIVVMGRKTFESLGSRPLPNRLNIVLTRSKEIMYIGRSKAQVIFVNSIEQMYLMLSNRNDYPYRDIWVIGGKQIYELFMSVADRIYISNIPQSHPINPKIPQSMLTNAKLQVKLDKSFVTKRNRYFKEHPAVTVDYKNFKVQIYTKL